MVADYYDTLGCVYLKKGLMPPAVEQLKKAVALEEDSHKKRNDTEPGISSSVRNRARESRVTRASARREVETSLRNIGDLTQREVSDAQQRAEQPLIREIPNTMTH